MSAEQTLLQEFQESKTLYDRTNEEGIYKRDLKKRIELINWALENMKDPEIKICTLIENKINELIDEINQKDSIVEADPLDSEIRILDWILYTICCDEIKKFERL
jgi:hypothetical protein